MYLQQQLTYDSLLLLPQDGRAYGTSSKTQHFEDSNWRFGSGGVPFQMCDFRGLYVFCVFF